jgi:hypothetical protein
VALVIGRLARVPDSALLGGRNQAAQAVASSASMVEMHMRRWKAVLSELRESDGEPHVRQEEKRGARTEHLSLR